MESEKFTFNKIIHWWFYLQAPAVDKDEEFENVEGRAQVRVLLWLGQEQDMGTWREYCQGANHTVFAETVSYIYTTVPHYLTLEVFDYG